MSTDPVLHRIRLVAWSAAALLILWQFLPWAERALVRMTAEPRPIQARGELAADESASIALFERVSPSVVYISTRQRVMNPWTRDITSVPRGTGSGFFWDELGHIVTNNHVIEGSSEAWVRLNDGRSYRATRIGASPSHDLAVLRVNVPFNPGPAVAVGTSGDLKVGQKVFAIGNPFGLDYSLTSGIVSALNRSIEDAEGGVIENLIQTDADINPGNSGGPLLDSAGRLIGINTAIYSPSGAYAGIGFAVPVDTINRVVPQLVADGRYVRPGLGILVDTDINRIAVAQLGIDGVVILGVSRGSVAAAAGLEPGRIDGAGNLTPGDVIVAIDDQPVDSVSALLALLDDYQVGDRVEVTLWRDGRRRDVEIVLQATG